MNNPFLSKFVTKPFFVSLVIFLFSIIVMLLLLIPLYESFKTEQQSNTYRIASDKAAKISFELYSRMHLNKATASFIEQNPNLDQKTFSAFVNSLIQYDNGVITSMSYEKDLVVTLIAPFEVNKNLIGVELKAKPELYEGIKKAIAYQKAFLEGPFQLENVGGGIGGGMGITSYMPVQITDSVTGEKKSIGVADVVMLWDKFLEVTELDVKDDWIEFAIRGVNGAGEEGAVFYGDSTIFHRNDAAKISIHLPLGEWVLAAHSKADLKARILPLAVLFAFALTFLFSFLIYLILKYSHKQIKRTERKYRYIAERSKDSLWTMDLKTMQFTYVSEAGLMNTGYTSEEFCNMKLENLLTVESLEIVTKEIGAAIDRLQKGIAKYVNMNFEIQQYTKYETLDWIDVSATATINEDGELEELVGSTRLINDRKKLEFEILQQKEELAKANITKNKFFSIIAHDLKNPIASLAKLAEVLDADYRGSKMDYLEEDIQMLGDTTKHTFKLLEDLLDWTRSQMNAITYNPTQTSLLKIITDCANYLNVQATAKNIKIQFASNEYLVNCDINMIHTILRNLISNAIKFSFKDSIIEVAVSDYIEDNNYVQVAVKDAGVGMDADSMSKLFKIDEKIVSSKGTNDESGTGLGLILCKEFIDKHNCKIWVESVKGEGTIFSFTLPKHAN